MKILKNNLLTTLIMIKILSQITVKKVNKKHINLNPTNSPSIPINTVSLSFTKISHLLFVTDEQPST